jgi:hypothetical protein
MSTAWSQQRKRLFNSGKNLRNGWLVALGLVALHAAFIGPYGSSRGINNSKATGLSVDNSTVESVRYGRGEGGFHQRGALPGRVYLSARSEKCPGALTPAQQLP